MRVCRTIWMVVAAWTLVGLFWADRAAGQQPEPAGVLTVVLADLPADQLDEEGWGEPTQIDARAVRLAKAGQDAWLRVKPWWTGAARPAHGQYWLGEVLYKDTAGKPVIFSAFGNLSAYEGRTELHRFGGLKDGQWKTARIPLPWDMIMVRPETGMAELSIRSSEGDLPVASIRVVPLAKERLGEAAERYNAETREWVARVQQPYRDKPRKEFAEPQKPAAAVGADKVVVPYVRSYMQVVYPYGAPQEGELDKALEAQLALNEYEPAAFGVYAASRDLTNVRVALDPLRHESDAQARLQADVRTAEYAFVPSSSARAEETTYALLPQRLWPMYATEIRKGQSGWFWVTFHSQPETTTPGLYRGKAVITCDQGRAELALRVRVLPIRLLEMNETDLRMGGCVTGLVSRHDMDEMLRHNHNQINLWVAGVAPRIIPKGQDDFDLDFALMDEFMEQMKAASLQASVYFLGGSPYQFPRTMTLERELAIQVLGMTREQFIELANQDRMNIPPQIVPLYRKWVQKVWQHATEKGWPEQILTPFDEPAAWKQTIGSAGPWIRGHFDQGCQLIHEAAPGWRVYGSIHHADKGINYLSVIDVFCTNAIDEDPQLGDKVRAAHKVFWQYAGVGDSTPEQARRTFGFFFNAFDSRGSLCWAYNWGARFDTTEGRNWLCAWYTPLDVIPTPSYEGLREAWDDRRYVETLKKVAKEKGVDIGGFLGEIAEAGKALAAEGGRGGADDFQAQVRRVATIDGLRARVIENILAISAGGKSTTTQGR